MGYHITRQIDNFHRLTHIQDEFDTPFRNASDNVVDDIPLSYGGTEYKRSEVNYIGQGMWGAASGETLTETQNLADEYKRKHWKEAATPGVLFWVEYGHNAWHSLNPAP